MSGSKAITPEQLDRVYIDLRQRVDVDEVDLAIHVWPQAWSNTRLGFRGMGATGLTNAVTVVAIVNVHDAYVYFDGRPAYRCDAEALMDQVRARKRPMAPDVLQALSAQLTLRGEELRPFGGGDHA